MVRATPNLNLTTADGVMVPAGLVTTRVSQLGSRVKDSGGSASDELARSRRCQKPKLMQDRRRRRKAVSVGHNENPMSELPGPGTARGSSRTS